VLSLRNPSGTPAAGYTYDPFGDILSSSGTVSNPWRFAGEYWDAESRYYKIGLRYYDPALGRWTQKDPLVGFEDPRRANRYIYAGQDPVNRVDPTGASFGAYASACAVGAAPAGVIGAYAGGWVGAGLGVAGGCATGAVGQWAEYHTTGPLQEFIHDVLGVRDLFRGLGGIF